MGKSIAIIGSTGRNSSAWVNAFLAGGSHVRNLVRDPSKSQPRSNLELVIFDLNNRSSYESALSGIELLALVTPPDPLQTERELALIEAAKKVGIERIVNLSVLGADLPAPISSFARWQAPVEAALKESGLPCVTLRPNSFMQNLLPQKASIERGQYVEPSGDKPCSLIDVRDIADVAVAVSDGAYDGRSLNLTGPQALTGSDIAQILSTARGHTVAFVSPPISDYRVALIDQGLPEWLVDALVELYEAVQGNRAGHLTRVTSEVEVVTGQSPRTLGKFAQEMFGH